MQENDSVLLHSEGSRGSQLDSMEVTDRKLLWCVGLQKVTRNVWSIYLLSVLSIINLYYFIISESCMSWFGGGFFLLSLTFRGTHWEIWKNNFHWSLFVDHLLCVFTIQCLLFTTCNRSPKPNGVVSAPWLDDYKFIREDYPRLHNEIFTPS